MMKNRFIVAVVSIGYGDEASSRRDDGELGRLAGVPPHAIGSPEGVAGQNPTQAAGSCETDQFSCAE